MNKEEKEALHIFLKILAFAMGLSCLSMFLDGCGGYRAALVPLDPAPVVSVENPTVSDEEERGGWPLWKKALFFGTVGH